MPTHDELEQKLKDIKEAMIYEFKEEDIEKVGTILIGFKFKICLSVILLFINLSDRLGGLVVRVSGYRCRGQGSIPGTTRFSEK
jgi:hypothetical protein